jgi:hypothetical protein
MQFAFLGLRPACDIGVMPLRLRLTRIRRLIPPTFQKYIESVHGSRMDTNERQ